MQIIPEMAKSVSHLTVYQRTPNWVIPRLDMAVSPIQQFLLKYVPPVRWCKRSAMMQFREASHAAITDEESMMARQTKKFALDALKKQLCDKPELWEKVIPNYAMGCKRIIISDDYFPTLNKKHVELNTREIERVTERGIQTADGDEQEYDLIVLATGFKTVEFMTPIQVYGKNGRSAADVWKDGAQAYYGVTVEDLPNFGMLYGPNTNLGHNSIILMIEQQSRYLSTLIGAVVESKIRGETLSLRPRPEIVQAFNERIQALLEKSTFADANCHSWYKQENGRITNNWPSTVVRYQKDLSQVVWTDYEAEGTGKKAIERKKPTSIGRVQEELPVSRTTLTLGALTVAMAVGAYYWNGGRGQRRR